MRVEAVRSDRACDMEKPYLGQRVSYGVREHRLQMFVPSALKIRIRILKLRRLSLSACGAKGCVSLRPPLKDEGRQVFEFRQRLVVRKRGELKELAFVPFGLPCTCAPLALPIGRRARAARVAAMRPVGLGAAVLGT